MYQMKTHEAKYIKSQIRTCEEKKMSQNSWNKLLLFHYDSYRNRIAKQVRNWSLVLNESKLILKFGLLNFSLAVTCCERALFRHYLIDTEKMVHNRSFPIGWGDILYLILIFPNKPWMSFGPHHQYTHFLLEKNRKERKFSTKSTK